MWDRAGSNLQHRQTGAGLEVPESGYRDRISRTSARRRLMRSLSSTLLPNCVESSRTCLQPYVPARPEAQSGRLHFDGARAKEVLIDALANSRHFESGRHPRSLPRL
jgi:hypothetical protein